MDSGKKKKIILVCVAIAVVLVLVAIGNKGVNFKKIYSKCEEKYENTHIWAKVGSDGSYLSIDSNPTDTEGKSYSDAYQAVKWINQELGLPESLNEQIGRTSYSDGTQTYNSEKLGISVSWKYHPDKGIEIIYSKLD